MFGLSTNLGYWTSSKEFECFSKIIYSEELQAHFIYKQPRSCPESAHV
jgi:hypothetical protein